MANWVLGALPSWLDLNFVRLWSGGLAILAVIVIIAVIVMARSVGTRLVVVVVVGTAIFGLLHYRQELDHCDKNACPCKFLGEDLPGGGCTPSR